MDRPNAVVLRALKLGDLLVAVPALRGLRRGLPDHNLLVACGTWLAPVVELVGGMDGILATDGLDAPLTVPDGGVDVVVNLHGNGAESRGRLDSLGARLRIGHAAPGWQGPPWRDDLHERERWTRLVRAHGFDADPADLHLQTPPSGGADKVGGGPGSAVVHVGAAYASRHWPTPRFAEVVVHLVRTGHDVLLTGNADERRRALDTADAAVAIDDGVADKVQVVAGEIPLQDFLAIVAHADLVVSADTGAAHLASAFGRPSVVLFGPALPEHWGPPPGPHRVLTHSRLRRGDPFAETPDPALSAVTVDEVIRAIDSLIL